MSHLTYDEKLKQRVKLLYLAQNDAQVAPGIGGGFRSMFNAACAKDAAFLISNAFMVNEPRAGDALRDVPFILRDFQEEYIRELQAAIEGNYSLLTDKTREMGVTWQVIAVGLWGWLFQRRFTMLMGSITEDKIDGRNNANTLFWKFDYLLENLRITCPWLIPAGYNPKEHRTHMKAYNPANGSMMLGEPMGPNFGRSGRVKVIFLDEFAEAANPVSTWASSSRTSNCRLVVFTPKGMNYAGQLANPKNEKQRTIRKITLHWMVDETKNYYTIHDGLTGALLASGNGKPNPAIYDKYPSAMPPVYPWYEEAKQALNYDPITIAQELDVNYNESVEGQMYPQIERARFGRFPYDPSLELYCSMDYGLSDMTALVWFQWNPYTQRFIIVDAYQARGKTIRWYIPFLIGGAVNLGSAEGGYTPKEIAIIERHAIMQGRYTDFFGDPAGKQKNQVTATSVLEVLASHKIYVRTNDKAREFGPRKHAVASALPYCDIDEEYCADLIQAIRDSRQRDTGTPVHGPESHYRSALEYGMVNVNHQGKGSMVPTLPPDDALYQLPIGLHDNLYTNNPQELIQAKRFVYNQNLERMRRQTEKADASSDRGGGGDGMARRTQSGWGSRRR